MALYRFNLDNLERYTGQKARIDREIALSVERARRVDKASWTEIGKALGISKQAAQQRFAPKPTDPTPTDTPLFLEGTR